MHLPQLEMCRGCYLLACLVKVDVVGIEAALLGDQGDALGGIDIVSKDHARLSFFNTLYGREYSN